MESQDLPRGQQLQGFASMEEMQAFLAEQEESAIADTRPEQWQITWGSRVLRMYSIGSGDDDLLAIFGHIYTEAEFLAENPQPPGSEAEEEILAELNDLRDQYTRGYRYGRWYSTLEPHGEWGSAHVVSLWEITTEEFNEARMRDWHIWRVLARKILQEVQASEPEAP